MATVGFLAKGVLSNNIKSAKQISGRNIPGREEKQDRGPKPGCAWHVGGTASNQWGREAGREQGQGVGDGLSR